MDTEIAFKAPKMNIETCLEKSFMYDINRFKSTDVNEIKEFIKKLLITNIEKERNFNNDERNVFYDILFHIQHLEATILKDKQCKCEFYFEIHIG